MTRFISSKNRFTVFLLWGLVLGMVFLLILSYKNNNHTFLPISILSLVIALIIWILLDTRYVIKNNNLLYRSGPFRGRISIFNITQIKKYSGLNLPVTMKPALDFEGFIITYNNFEEVFVSPKQQDFFIDELLKINSNIKYISSNQ